MAQQISRRHTIISFTIMLMFTFFSSILAIILLKCLGYAHSGIMLKQIITKHRKIVTSILLFIHLVPVNYYAIIRVFSSEYSRFQLKVFSKH